MARSVLLVLVSALALGGCREKDPKLPLACVESQQAILSALAKAPGPVHLRDGSLLSTCVANARSDADLQGVGIVLTQAGDALARALPRSDSAALELGYLVGATRRGAAHTGGIHVELRRHLEQTTGIDGPPPRRRAAYRRGLVAGSRGG